MPKVPAPPRNENAALEPSPAKTPAVPSPCIQVCRLDAAGVCEGCHRTREEITLWTRLTEAQQRAVVERCRERSEARTRAAGDQRLSSEG